MPGDFVFPKDKGPLMYYQNEKVKLVNWLMRLNDFNEDFGWNPDTQWRVPQAPGFSAIPCPEEMISKVYISLGFVWLYYCIALHGEWGATKFWHASKPPPYDRILQLTGVALLSLKSCPSLPSAGSHVIHCIDEMAYRASLAMRVWNVGYESRSTVEKKRILKDG